MLGRRQNEQAVRTTWSACSALLRYPSEQLVAALPAIREALDETGGRDRRELLEMIDRWSQTPLTELQERYVEVFDLGKRAALHVSWHQYGDRRQRGIVLLKLKRRYQEFGLSPIEDELPDWLPLMLEFAAAAPSPEGVSLLQEWRAAIELIRRTLHEEECDHAVVLDAISATLPKLGADIGVAVEKLVAEGPPGDEVGLEPFGPDNEFPPSGFETPDWSAPEQPSCAQGAMR
jgi:nitrate reductase delta subunit